MRKHAAFLRSAAALLLTVCMLSAGTGAQAQVLEENVPITLTAPSLMLLEAESGAVIFEKNADVRRPVASVTKLMTALLVLERLERGDITLDDMVTVSQNAAAVIGSQALLDANSQYPLKTLLQATIMASGNDSAVALAEYTAGTEEAFANLMNEKARELGMINTQYVNCTGLPAEGQYTTARDVAMLCCKVAEYEQYFDYSSIWIDQLPHPGGRVTDLTNTNRLVRFYTDCDGFKTGSTNEAKYCVSATAKRNGMRLIAIILGAESSQKRFDEARAMLDYGFATYRRAKLGEAGKQLGTYVPVTLGALDQVEAALGGDISLLLKSGQEKNVVFETELMESIQAPVSQGDVIGHVNVMLDGKVIARVDAVAADDVRLPGFLEGFVRIFEQWK